MEGTRRSRRWVSFFFFFFYLDLSIWSQETPAVILSCFPPDKLLKTRRRGWVTKAGSQNIWWLQGKRDEKQGPPSRLMTPTHEHRTTPDNDSNPLPQRKSQWSCCCCGASVARDERPGQQWWTFTAGAQAATGVLQAPRRDSAPFKCLSAIIGVIGPTNIPCHCQCPVYTDGNKAAKWHRWHYKGVVVFIWGKGFGRLCWFLREDVKM